MGWGGGGKVIGTGREEEAIEGAGIDGGGLGEFDIVGVSRSSMKETWYKLKIRSEKGSQRR
jgi:hypothetical protein